MENMIELPPESQNVVLLVVKGMKFTKHVIVKQFNDTVFPHDLNDD